MDPFHKHDATDPAYADERAEQSRPKKAISVGKLSDLSNADLGAAKTVAVAVDPMNAPMEKLPPPKAGSGEVGEGPQGKEHQT